MTLSPRNTDEYSQPKFGMLTVLGMNGQNQDTEGRKAHYKIELTDPISKYGQPTVIFDSRHADSEDVENNLTNTETVATIWLERDGNELRVPFVQSRRARLFQLGRSTSEKIDFHVDAPKPYAVPVVSRFACRILVDRAVGATGGNEARIYASAFDEENKIFMGEHVSAMIERLDATLDAFTSNGVLLLRPRCRADDADMSWTDQWREVSIFGRLFKVHEKRNRPNKDDEAINEENTLVDGTIIDLGGVQLMWRTSKPPVTLDWLKNSFMKKSVQKLVSCAGNNATLIFNEKNCHPCAYTNCGHVVTATRDGSGAPQPSDQCAVASCHEAGKLVSLKESLEPLLFVDDGPLEYCFNPCGHIVNLATARLWSNVAFKTVANGVSICPFCSQYLDSVKPIIKLVLTAEQPELRD